MDEFRLFDLSLIVDGEGVDDLAGEVLEEAVGAVLAGDDSDEVAPVENGN